MVKAIVLKEGKGCVQEFYICNNNAIFFCKNLINSVLMATKYVLVKVIGHDHHNLLL